MNFCEFDKYAAQAYCSIHDVEESLNLGDITQVDETKLNDFTMICGGSPCQDFSVAGKQNGSVWRCNECENSDGTPTEWNPLTIHYMQRDKCPCCGSENIDKSRSSLLVEYLRVIRHNKPNFGIYENVKNIVGKKFKDTFKMFTDELEEYGYSVRWKVLNAKDYGVPQNRERVYLIFIKKDLDNGKFKFPEPFDNGIRLKDILEPEVNEKYYISDEKVQRFLTNLNNKDALLYDACQVKREGKSREYNEYCPTLTARDYKDPRLVNDNQVKQLGNIVNTGNWDNPQRGRIYSPDGCSPALNTCGGGGLEPKILQIGKLNSSQDGVVIDPEGIAKTHTAGHNNTPKIICGIDKSINETKIIDNANCITTREDRGISNRKSEGTAILELPDYSYCLDANYYKGTTPEQYVNKHRRQLIFEGNAAELSDYINSIINCLDIMNDIKGELKYEDRYKRCGEILHILWEEVRKEKIQWQTRGFWSIQKKKILQSRVHDKIQVDTTKSRCNMENCSSNSTENKPKNIKKNKVRDMWQIWKGRCTSYKLELERQFVEEFTGFMSKLSQQNSQNQECLLDMWATDERTRLLQQALLEIQEIRMSIDEKEKCKMSRLQSNIRESDKMCELRIRKLTPKETFRLMGFSDEDFYKAMIGNVKVAKEFIDNNPYLIEKTIADEATTIQGISNSQLYKMSGNSIVVDVLYYIYVELY